MTNPSPTDEIKDEQTHEPARSLGKKVARDWAVAVGLLLVLSLLGYGQLLRPGMVPYSPYSDNIAYNLASKQVLFDAVRAGRGVPMWRGYQLSGSPAMTQPQAMYTYPLHFLFWISPPEAALGWTLWLHMLLAGLAFFWLGGVLHLPLAARLVMACAGLFSFKLIMAIYAGWLPLLPGFVLVPLLCGVVFDAIQRPRWQSALWMAVVGGLCLHTGHLQFLYYTTLALSMYLLYWALAQWRAGAGREAFAVLAWLGAGSLLALGVAMYLLVPLALEAAMTTRLGLGYADFLGGHTTQLRSLLTFLRPEALGTPLHGSYLPIELWEHVAYFGLIPLVLAVVGAVGERQRPFVPFLSACFVGAVVLSFDSPLLRFCFDVVPGFRFFRLPGRLLFVSAMCGLLLAGVGWGVLLEKWKERPRLGLWLTCAALFCICAEGSWYARRYVTVQPQRAVMPTPAYAKWFARQERPFRVAPLGRATLNAGWAARLQLSLITGYEPFSLGHYQEYMSLLQAGRVLPRGGAVWTDLQRVARPDLLDALNVRYVVSPSPLPARATRRRFRLVKSWPKQPMFLLYGGVRQLPMFVYENARALPRVYWARRVIEAPTRAAALRWVARHPLGRDAVLLRPGSQGSGVALVKHRLPPSTMTTPQVVMQQDGLLMAMVRTKRRRFLVLSEVWHKGWRAYIDGKEVPLARTNVALMGVWVPPGTHQVKLSFRPLGWPGACYTSLFAVLLCLFWGVWAFFRSLSSKAQRSASDG